MNRLTVCFMLFLCKTIAVVSAEILWVDGQSVMPGPDGSAERPFYTVQDALLEAQDGQRIVVKEGVYRETVTVSRGVTLSGEPGARVVLNGAVPVTDWIEGADGVFEAFCETEPDALFTGFCRQPLARSPEAGWWNIEAAESLGNGIFRLTDTKNLSVFDDLTGASVYVWAKQGNTYYTCPVQSVNPEAGTIEIKSPSRWMTELVPGDKYWIQNHPSLISRPGEWCRVAENGGFTLHFRPAQPDDLAAAQIPFVQSVLRVSNADSVRIENLEVFGGRKHGMELNNVKNSAVVNCTVHQNAEHGINLRSVNHIEVSRNLIFSNEYGVSFHSATNITVSMNEICANGTDGLILSWGTRNATVSSNYIHHHVLWGHPDNTQFYRNVSDVRFEGNLLLCGGQGVMMEEVENAVFRGNMLVGSEAVMLIFGHGNANRSEVTGNTVAYAGYGCLSLTGSGYKVYENILMSGGKGSACSMREASDYTGDANLFWSSDRTAPSTLLISGSGWHKSLEEYRKTGGTDRRSVQADPLFVNAPAVFTVLDAAKLVDSTEQNVFVRSTEGFKAGELIEFNFSGKAHTIVKVDPDNSSISFDPPLENRPLKCWQVAGWGTNSNLKLDLRLRPESPGAKLAKGGLPAGSSIDIFSYQSADFDADGQRDIPAFPDFKKFP